MNIVIIGGGAAGFFAAIRCAEKDPNVKVIILERSSKVLTKVKVSGGGRCNVTHACDNTGLLVTHYPRGEKELRQTFARFTVEDTVAWFAARGVQLHTEDDGRMFPETDRSETIIKCFEEAAEKAGVNVWLDCEVRHIEKKENRFILKIKDKDDLQADKILVASGGHPKSTAYEWLSELGHTIVPPVPSLFTFNVPDNDITKLMGVAVADARVKIAGTKLEQRGPMLITHWGLSGPAVLKSSAWGARALSEKNYDFICIVSWLPAMKQEELFEQLQEAKQTNPSRTLFATSLFGLPKRLWQFLLDKAGIDADLRWADLPKKNLNALVNYLLSDEYKVSGKTTFKEEFVTCGGISLKEVDFATMQSKIVPGLFFAGEVLNIDGVTGGFNFQNAWSTAWVGAEGILTGA